MNLFKKLVWVIGFSTLLICSLITSAVGETQIKTDSEFLLFDSKAAFSQLDIIKKKTVAKPKDLDVAKSTSNKLEKLQTQAKICVEKANDQLAILNNLIESLQSMTEQTVVKRRGAFNYLTTKKDKYTQQAIDCRFFVFQSQEVLTELKENIQRITTEAKLTRATPIWSIFVLGTKTLKNFDSQKFYQASGLTNFTVLSLITFFAIVLASLLLAIFLRKKYFRWNDDKQKKQKKQKEQKEKSKLKITLTAVIRKHIIPLLLFGSISGYLSIMFASTKAVYTIGCVSYSLLAYFVLLSILSFLFSPPKPAVPIIHKIKEYGQAVFIRLKRVLILLVTTSITVAIFNTQELSPQLAEVSKSFFMMLLSINIVWIGWLFTTLPILEKIHKRAPIFVKAILFIILFIVIIIQAFGYYRLAAHVIFGVLFVILASTMFYLLIRATKWLEKSLNTRGENIPQKIRYYLGLKYPGKITEFIFIKISIYLFASYGFFLLLLVILGASLNYIDRLNEAFMEGLVLVKIRIIPFQLILAMFVFGALLMLGRCLTSSIKRKQNLQNKEDTQNAMASLFSYIIFCVSFIIAMIIAGIDFTSLTVIVGALSVGIGLGLQHIANNFISGIILLVEKPFKSGDRVIINEKEGIVKRIRLRSTQIRTLAKEDIIVPNSDFITKQITNYTFSDKLSRISCRVGVSYDSDVDLVKEILLEIAEKNPDVIQDETSKPVVLFKEFADSSLDFALYCTINDAHQRFYVISDLNTTIFKEFKKRNIEIAYPQLDVHMTGPAEESPKNCISN